MDGFSALSLTLANREIKTTVVFQGGGAKGICHVGALRAIEDANSDSQLPTFVIHGVAGTSIGALMAALVSVGYCSKELIADDGRFPICDDRGLKIPKDLLGAKGWSAVRILRFLIRVARDPKQTYKYWRYGSIACFLLVTMGIAIYYPYYAMIFIALCCAMAFISVEFMAKGVSDLSGFEAILNEVLIDKFSEVLDDKEEQELKERGLLLFSDLAGKRKKLRIVAAETARDELHVFSEEITPEVPVARAVCASMAIPFVFKPVKIGESKYFDGGIVSNIPAWTFDGERAIDPDVISLVFDISKIQSLEMMTSAAKRARIMRGLVSIAGIITTAAFGSTVILELKKSDRVHRVPLQPKNVGLLDFTIGYQLVQE